MKKNALFRSVPALVLLCALPPAQDLSAIRDSFGASRAGSGAWAGGPDYSARFDGVGPTFAPRHGVPGEASHGVRFRLESVRRGSEVVFERAADVAPEVADNCVSYAHRSDLTEKYEARRDGIEQSFVFAARPEGRGDLVVRGAIETALPLVGASDEGVRYELPGIAGVTFGAVTGVDANGAQARGSIRAEADGAHVEWVLPAAFVDTARYPLVLDPLIGSVISVGDSSNGADSFPNVAFDVTTNRYLVVWNDPTAAANPDIRGQFLSASGTLVGSSFFIGWGRLTRRALANINGTGRFLVAADTHFWSGITSSVRVRSIDAGTGSVSNSVDIEVFYSGSGQVVNDPVVGGDSRGLVTSDSALIAYERSGEIRTCIVHVPATGDPVVSASSFTTIGTGTAPSVTAHGGNPLRWLVTWQDNAYSASSPQHVRAGLVGTSAALCAPVVLLYIAIGNQDVRDVTCAAADGSHFLVAWTVANGSNTDIYAMPLTWSGTCGTGTLSTGSLLAPLTTAGHRSSPALAFAKDKYLLGFASTPTSGVPRIRVKGLDPSTCESCGLEWAADSGLLATRYPSIASRFDAGDAASDEAMIVWSDDTVRARRCEARGNDAVTSMGGGCVNGLNDFATYSGDAVLGNTDFQLSIAGSVSLPLVLIVGFSAVSAPCGNCTIVPSPDILFPATNPYTLAIPCDPLLVGVNLYTQWLVLKPSTCPILPDFSFTNALRFTIGE